MAAAAESCAEPALSSDTCDALRTIYGEKEGNAAVASLDALIREVNAAQSNSGGDVDKDFGRACLIAYADSLVPGGSGALAAEHKSVTGPGITSPLRLLADFMHTNRHHATKIGDAFPVLHILPFYPWDTDRGFSVKDYREVDQRNGCWEDVDCISSGGTELMFDFVANHASVENILVQGALISRHLSGEECPLEFRDYKDFVIAFSDDDKPSEATLSLLSRPRPHPVLTKYFVFERKGNQTISAQSKYEARLGEPSVDAPDVDASDVIGQGWVWTTFSRGKDPESGKECTRQVDLNFSNWSLLVEVVRILVEYAKRGCTIIRLDAVGYIWKRLGGSCLHEENAHRLIRVMGSVLQKVAKGTLMIAEVNEPNSKLLPYLGTPGETKESDMVYQFAAYPMAVHAVLREQAEWYAKFLASTKVFNGKQYVTILGSHDGMAMKQAAELLPAEELDWFGSRLSGAPHNCLVNYASLPGGNRILYECCGTPWSVVNGTASASKDGPEQELLCRDRYLAVIALGQLVRGMPAMYVLGLLCSENFVPDSGLDENRTILRERLEPTALSSLLKNEGECEPRFVPVCRQIQATAHPKVRKFFRAAGPAPEPLSDVKSVPDAGGVLCVRLGAVTSHSDTSSPENAPSSLLVAVNVTSRAQQVTCRANHPDAKSLKDLLGPMMEREPIGPVQCQDSGDIATFTWNMPPYGVAWFL